MMRPDPHGDADPRYECTDCGRRLSDGERETLICPDCEGPLRNIGAARDF